MRLLQGIVLLHNLPLLTVVRGYEWEPIKLNVSKFVLNPTTSQLNTLSDFKTLNLVDALSVFKEDRLQTVGLVLNLDPAALLVVFKDASAAPTIPTTADVFTSSDPTVSGLQMFIVTTGTVLPTTPPDCHEVFRFISPSNNLVGVDGRLVALTALLGVALHAGLDGVTFPTLLAVARSSENLLRKLHASCSVDMSDLVNALSAASDALFQATHDKTINLAICDLFDLLPSHVVVTCHADRARSAKFRYGGAFIFNDTAQSSACALEVRPNQIMMFKINKCEVPVLQLGIRNADIRGKIKVILVTPTGAISIHMPLEFTRQQCMYEMVRVVRDVRAGRTFGNVSHMGQRCIPAEDFLSDNMSDMVACINTEPLQFPQSGNLKHFARIMDKTHQAVGNQFPAEVMAIMGQYFDTNPVKPYTRIMDKIHQVIGETFPSSVMDILRQYVDTKPVKRRMQRDAAALNVSLKASAKSQDPDDPIVVCVAPMASQLYASLLVPPIEYSSEFYDRVYNRKVLTDVLCPIMVKELHDHHQCFYPKPEFTTCPEEKFAKRQQFTRGELSVRLFFENGNIFIFLDAGVVGAVLRDSPNLYQTLERSIQYAVKHYTEVPAQRPCIIQNVNPFLLDSSSVDVRVDLMIGVRMQIHATTRPFELRQQLDNYTFRDNVKHHVVLRMLTRQFSERENVHLMASVTLLNNDFPLIVKENVIAARGNIFKYVAQQLSELEEDEPLQKFKIDLPNLELYFGVGIERLYWLSTLLDMPNDLAIRAIGHFTVNLNLKDHRQGSASVSYSPIPRPGPLRSYTSGDVPGMVATLGKLMNDIPVDMSLDYCIALDALTAGNANGAKDLDLQIRVDGVPSFFVGDETVLPVKYSNIICYPRQEEANEDSLFRWCESYFHAMATIAVKLMLYRIKLDTEADVQLYMPPLIGQEGRHYDRLGGAALKCMTDAIFSIVPTPESAVTAFCAMCCTLRDDAKDEPSSDLAKLMLKLPLCMGNALPGLTTASVLLVPHGTPLVVLQLAVHLQLGQCGCLECRQLIGVRFWNLGQSACTGPDLAPILQRCPVVPEPSELVELRHFMGPKMFEYLKLCQNVIVPRLCSYSELNITYIDIPAFEMRFNNSGLSFVWDRAAKKRKADA